jgi:hypothetical protein
MHVQEVKYRYNLDSIGILSQHRGKNLLIWQQKPEQTCQTVQGVYFERFLEFRGDT